VTAVAVTSTPTLEGGRVFASNNAAARVTAARSVANGGIDVDDPAAAARSDDAASSMLEKGKGNKKWIGGYCYSGVIRSITTQCGLSFDSLTFVM
jgi:hypothetical protein